MMVEARASSRRASHRVKPPAESTPTTSGRPVPRGEQARQRVLSAALDLLAEQGMTGFTMEAVAQRAAASKTTVYSRWPNRNSLLTDAMDAVSVPLPPPIAGDLRGDLIELVEALDAMLHDEPFGRLLAAFIDAAEREPALSRLHAGLTQRRRAPFRDVLLTAQTSGEITQQADIELTIDMLTGPSFYRRYITHQTGRRDYANSLVDSVLAGISRTTQTTVQRSERPEPSRRVTRRPTRSGTR
jgi:AcrR family transcriptional regulator